MFNARLLGALVLLAPLFGIASTANAAPKKDVNAIRAECFRQANAAASAASSNMSAGESGARNAAGYSAYRACARKHGIRP
jgi:hypothetical protein